MGACRPSRVHGSPNPNHGGLIRTAPLGGNMMRSAHLHGKKVGALALAIVASSATMLVLAQSPASAGTPAVLDSHYTASQLASGLSSPANGLRFRAPTNDLLVSEFGADRITKIGASSGTQSPFPSLSAPNELAIDSGGH